MRDKYFSCLSHYYFDALLLLAEPNTNQYNAHTEKGAKALKSRTLYKSQPLS